MQAYGHQGRRSVIAQDDQVGPGANLAIVAPAVRLLALFDCTGRTAGSRVGEELARSRRGTAQGESAATTRLRPCCLAA